MLISLTNFSRFRFIILLVIVLGLIILGGWYFGLKDILAENNDVYEIPKLEGKVVEVLELSCVNHTDCTTPMEYLIQSNCPYIAQCIDQKCTVICPRF